MSVVTPPRYGGFPHTSRRTDRDYEGMISYTMGDGEYVTERSEPHENHQGVMVSYADVLESFPASRGSLPIPHD